MSPKTTSRPGASIADVQAPFKFVIVHGNDPARKSAAQKAFTKTISLNGLIFDSISMDYDGFHLSFTESSYGRNFLEVTLDLGKRFGPIEFLGQVDWYERRPTPTGYVFSVGLSYVDVQADALAIIREFIQQAKTNRI